MQEFGFTKMDMGFIQTCFFDGYALMQVPEGIWADRFGLPKTSTFAILWWSIFIALMGWLGWQGVFIIFGILGIVVAYAWHHYTQDSPEDCPYIIEEEINYINEAHTDQKEKAVAP